MPSLRLHSPSAKLGCWKGARPSRWRALAGQWVFLSWTTNISLLKFFKEADGLLFQQPNIFKELLYTVHILLHPVHELLYPVRQRHFYSTLFTELSPRLIFGGLHCGEDVFINQRSSRHVYDVLLLWRRWRRSQIKFWQGHRYSLCPDTRIATARWAMSAEAATSNGQSEVWQSVILNNHRKEWGDAYTRNSWCA